MFAIVVIVCAFFLRFEWQSVCQAHMNDNTGRIRICVRVVFISNSIFHPSFHSTFFSIFFSSLGFSAITHSLLWPFFHRFDKTVKLVGYFRLNEKKNTFIVILRRSEIA